MEETKRSPSYYLMRAIGNINLANESAGYNIAGTQTAIEELKFAMTRLVVYINHSGGAVGSDYEWGKQGEKYGVISKHYWHGKQTAYGNVEITEDEFNEGKQHVYKANETLKRRPERYMDLLARNYCQVKNADAIFAIGHIKDGIVDGGTGWAVQMAIDDKKTVYLYDQDREKWFVNIDGKWDYSEVPILTKNFAGIGSRNINTAGVKAIGEVYIRTFGY